MIGQHLQVLLLKSQLAVVFHLTIDVLDSGSYFRSPNRERTITILPMEFEAGTI